MNIGMLRVKNEARWIERSIASILPLCSLVLVMDDHSTDDTLRLAEAMPRVNAFESPFSGLDEARDKNLLLDRATEFNPDWIVCIDGDEVMAPGAADKLQVAMQDITYQCLSLRVLYLWDCEDQVRTDGVYGDFHRESVFRPAAGARFSANGNGGNFHCGNVPWALRQNRRVLPDVPLLHFGYLHSEDRLRKYHFYNEKDPNNILEDRYSHIVQGDLPEFPADARLVHGGPLRLGPISTLFQR